MNQSLNREILRLAVPSILAGITVPLVGMVDTAVAGHLAGDSAAQIGAISVGSMVLSLLYWCFGFLRTGTGGLTAQAFGRQDPADCGRIFLRGMGLALLAALAALVLQWPFFKGVMRLTDATPGVKALAERYFFIRIWAAPATMTLMALRGWFVGMQNSVDSMWMDLIVNGVNILASILLAFGIGPWPGLGFAGIPLGTVIAQYCGLAYGLWVCRHKYGRDVFSLLGADDLRALLHDGSMGRFFRMNLDLLGRSFFFILIYIGFTMINAGYGDRLLAAGSIMMQLLMFFSYFTDGFAYAGEALSGRFIGARDGVMLRRSVRYVFAWSLALAVLFVGLYASTGLPVLRLLTSDEAVVQTAWQFLPWLLLMPPLGCAAFTWDGIYLGATASRALRDSMGLAAAAFFGVWYIGKWLLQPEGAAAIHLLFVAYFAHLAARTVHLSVRYRRDVLGAAGQI
ncbi:MAG: MATE family efflux transporter [Bacteroidales bacterium]|nr:MATE family efflux transporter [Bacteroidales bacterium]